MNGRVCHERIAANPSPPDRIGTAYVVAYVCFLSWRLRYVVVDRIAGVQSTASTSPVTSSWARGIRGGEQLVLNRE